MIRKEADEQKVKLQKMKDDGKDEYDVRKMAEVLQEQSHIFSISLYNIKDRPYRRLNDNIDFKYKIHLLITHTQRKYYG